MESYACKTGSNNASAAFFDEIPKSTQMEYPVENDKTKQIVLSLYLPQKRSCKCEYKYYYLRHLCETKIADESWAR